MDTTQTKKRKISEEQSSPTIPSYALIRSHLSDDEPPLTFLVEEGFLDRYQLLVDIMADGEYSRKYTGPGEREILDKYDEIDEYYRETDTQDTSFPNCGRDYWFIVLSSWRTLGKIIILDEDDLGFPMKLCCFYDFTTNK